MKNQVIRDRFAALSVLSQRVLPGTTAINKVATLLLRFKTAYDATEVQRKNILAEYPVPSDWEKDTLPQYIAEQRQNAIEDMLAESQPIKKVPDSLRLADTDLPKVLKREGGEGNVEGLANLKMMLGGLYRASTKEELDFAAATAEGEEEEEFTPPAVDERAPEHSG